MSEQKADVVNKGSTEFKETKERFIRLLCESKDEEIIRKGISEYGEHKGEHLGITTKRILTANLPMPFGCADLFVNPCIEGDKLVSVVWFCDRVGCICSCCREDMDSPKEEYPIYCPSRSEVHYYGKELEE